jgi:hypothetical protein
MVRGLPTGGWLNQWACRNYCVTDAVMNTREATGRLLAIEPLAEVQWGVIQQFIAVSTARRAIPRYAHYGILSLRIHGVIDHWIRGSR